VDTLTRLIASSDHLHLPPFDDARARRYKEWLHFCVLGPEVQLILNLSLSGDTRPVKRSDERLARVIVLTHDEAWDGDVDLILPSTVQLHPSEIDLRLGHNTVELRDTAFVVSAALQERPVALAFKLRPLAMPLLMHNSMTLPDGDMNWLVMPRLFASGTVTVDQRVHILKDAPAYHDHNWGHWLWGQDFAWQWGFALPDNLSESPWNVVFCRATNRARNRVTGLTLALWKNDCVHRVFTQREIKVSQAGYLRRKRVDKYPRVMALASPESTTDVPRLLEFVAASNGDEVSCRFSADDVAQVVIPNETDLDSTAVNQVIGRFEMEGHVGGEAVSMKGRGIFEFLVA